jgi:hypothetical protein
MLTSSELIVALRIHVALSVKTRDDDMASLQKNPTLVYMIEGLISIQY